MKTALTISASDCCGAAGIQGDLKTFSVLGVYGMSAVTAIVVQNTQGIREFHKLDAKLVAQQIDAMAGDIEIDACKTGVLVNQAIVEAVEDCLKRNKLVPYICDPALASREGQRRLDEAGWQSLKKKLLPLATLVTPDLAEAAAIAGVEAASLTGAAAIQDVCRRIVGAGAKSVVVKGFPLQEQMVDYYFDGHAFLEFAGKMQPKEKSYGSGAAFSAAITAGLALKMPIPQAIDQAKSLVNMAIQYSDGQGRGIAPINVLAFATKKK
jgi:hydroxymethylpyrimidine/phosphomethylpyrimidine kinase